MSLTIRPYRSEDRTAVIALWQACELTRPWNDPDHDIARATFGPTSTILIAVADEAVRGTVMVGHDGHRGWLYYLAVAPHAQRGGIGRALVAAAEAWLIARAIPKVETMVRDGNTAEAFYAHLDYERQEVATHAKWLTDAPPARTVEVARTYLEMRAPSGYRPPPPSGQKLALAAIETADVDFHRYLYDKVGRDWDWWDRKRLSDADLLAVVDHADVDVYVLYVDGVPGGFFELNGRTAGEVEIAYFGLAGFAQGRGLGPYLLGQAIELAWARHPDRVWLHTCTLDHPAALGIYQKAGFVPYDRLSYTDTLPARPL